MTRFLSLVVLIVVTASASAAERDIFAANRALGRGVNLGNFLEFGPVPWAVPIEARHLPLIRAAGFDSIRLPCKWSVYAAAEAPYTIDPAFIQRVDELLDAAEAAGLNVVLNIHHFNELDADPEGQRDRFVGIWKQLAAHYADRGEWLYLELDNEPHDQLTPERWNDILKDGLAAVRATNPTRPVVIGCAEWGSPYGLAKLELPADDRHIIATVHYYLPMEFTHQGANWSGERLQAIRDQPWLETEADVAELRKFFDEMAAWAKERNLPLYLGEFGAYEKAPFADRVRWTAAVRREAEARGMSWAYWEFGAGFGVYDLKAEEWRDPLLRALLPK